jgi:pimeloyl-ACP methyl ester carboxylesterase
MASLPRAFYKDQEPSARPIWLEALIGLDWIALRTSPVFYGLGVKRGDGSAVVVVPGFMGTDLYLQELYSWLRRIGYSAYMSQIGRNADCLDLLVERLSDTIETARAETGGRVHLIGHSLGGILALAASSINRDHIASVITLGSPFRGIRSHPMVLGMARLVRERINRERRRGRRPDCYTGYCTCDAVGALESPYPQQIPKTAIYTKTDGIVDWRFCIYDDPETDFEVIGTHSGLVFNPYVYELIAERLASNRIE